MALTLLQLPFSLRSLQEYECKKKLLVFCLSILRSVPELHHNDRGFNSGWTLVGSHRDPAEKPKYLTKALDRHCSGESLVLADDRFLFSNMDMQHIQHYAYCSVLAKTPFCHTTELHSVSWRTPEKLPRSLHWKHGSCALGFSPTHMDVDLWKAPETASLEEPSSVSVLTAEMAVWH